MRDSLDIVEIVMAIEEALDLDLSDADAELPAKEILERIERGEFPDGLEGDDFSAFVRKLGPRYPRGQAGAAVKLPEKPDAG
ncbi:MAG TPA: hypothetical protein VKG25_04755 [Bryobacteraceae bacterium]|nr:hypothetical protein [Bryobacteraceae bacterium]